MTPTSEYLEIVLTQGQTARVDAFLYEWLSHWSWSARWNKHTKSFYALRNSRVSEGGKRRIILMHRQILGLETGDPRKGDHQDGDTLNNRGYNLRIASLTQNNQNAKCRADNMSGCRGVGFSKRHGLWTSRIWADKKAIFLGYHATRELAVDARYEAEMFYHGKFRRMP
jgi:hypothetical protein